MNAIDWTSVIQTLIGTFCGAVLAFGSSVLLDSFVKKRNRSERIQIFLLAIQKNAISIKKINDKLVWEKNQNQIQVAIFEISNKCNLEYRVYPVRKTYHNMKYDIFKSSQKKPGIRYAIEQIVELQELLLQKIDNIDKDEISKLESRELNEKANGVSELIKMHDKKIESIDWFINKYHAKIDADG